MANYTPAPEDEYDVLIEGDLNDHDLEATWCPQYDTRTLSAGLVPQLYSALFMAGILGHTWLVFVLVKYKGLRHVENIYFLNLTISNLCFLFTLPLWAHTASHGGILGDPMCKIVTGLYSVGLYSEALWNTLLIVQRYLVFFDVRRISSAARTMTCSIIASVLAWGTVFLVTLPELMFYKPKVEGQCSFNKPSFLPAEEPFWKHFLTLKMNILGLLFPLIISIFCYLQMRKTLRFQERRYNLFKLVFAIMVIFLLMWGPYNIVLFLATFKEFFSLHDCKSTYHLDGGVQITKFLAASHCCVNPLLFMFLNKTFRKCLCPLCGNTPLQTSQVPAHNSPQGELSYSTEV
ncbi:C-C chemokine receptor-like 2 [Talpa occidentalis]|uniref:C-C chemokine receptor-like 2 n=1 Tax=Talpa occidentalis TaxID=50954 RepID=UPI00188F5D85|nr:C-C chemokine receptor-like 2 [Talpa occidentalis]XP_037376190.1 C-C chemokine receptor-like 2 [Talpa occidentalis]XP_037376197.1 C-C chemokine receptor-like 2 [Talpa occidentalis]